MLVEKLLNSGPNLRFRSFVNLSRSFRRKSGVNRFYSSVAAQEERGRPGI